jgi:hypothetical protein
MALIALQAFDCEFASLGGQSERGTLGAEMTWSSNPKR